MNLFKKKYLVLLVTMLVVPFNIYTSLHIFDFYFLEEDNCYRTLKILRRIFLVLTLTSINFSILSFILPYFCTTNQKNLNVDKKIK